MSIKALTDGAIKGGALAAIALVIAPQLTAGYIALKAAQFGAKSLADEHNSCCHSGASSKEGHSEVASA